MGYYISMEESKFLIPNENVNSAMQAIKNAFKGKNKVNWVYEEDVKRAHEFSKLMEVCYWDIEYDEDGNVELINFNGEKFGEYIEFVLGAIAPYVEAGSYIEFSGEDGSRWRYIFDVIARQLGEHPNCKVIAEQIAAGHTKRATRKKPAPK